MAFWVRSRLLSVVIVVVVAAGVVGCSKSEDKKLITAPVTRGDVTASIEATGTVQPLVQVQIGSQVSGRVKSVKVDFNDTVKEGELLAELDPTPFEAQVAQARASLASAQAQAERAAAELSLQEKNLERAKSLREKGLNASADLDQAQGARDAAVAGANAARAQIEQAKANLASAEENLKNSKIRSPIAGTVINRSIDPGQTVAASFQAPELFVIAHDLATMQVIASIDEADVGKIAAGAKAKIRVDAFPNDAFEGTVRELRYQATTTQGVVTYPAVLDVANAERKLRPGMTATLTLITAEKSGVLRVPNAALRFKPQSTDPSGGKGGGGKGGGAGGAGASDKPKKGDGQRVYVLKDGAPVAVPVEIGATDGTVTEIVKGELAEGADVIVDDAAATPQTGGPGGQQRRGPRVF